MFFIINIISIVSAYKLLCLSHGQKLPSAENPRYECEHDYCINICTTDNYYPTNPRYCIDMGACELFGETELDVTPPNLTINSPLQGEIYNSRSVLFDIESNEPCSLSYLDNINGRGRWSTLASNIQEYLRRISFNDGLNNITIKGKDRNNNKAFYDIQFYVDSKEPRIRRVEPRRGFASGLFSVEFDEENPKELLLYYGNSIKNKTVDIENNCTEDRGNYECQVQVNLSEFDGKEIEYWFVLEDMAGNIDESGHEFVDVDYTAPVINSAELVQGRKDELIVNVTEENFDEIEYIDWNDDRRVWRSLCRRLDRDDGLCHGRARFDDGLHNVTIKAKDEAGLETIYYMEEFFTDSKEPRIKGTEPRRGFASGLFQVEFDEENPKEIWLSYGQWETGWQNVEVDLSNCYESRRNTICEIWIDLDRYDGQEIEYYFTIEDIVGNTDESRLEKLDVDITAPVINEFNWTQGEERYSSYIYFFFNITEINFDEIEYIDRAEEPRRQRWRRLCSRLDKEDRDSDTGTCEERERFRDGHHILDIQITDEAGNAVSTERIEFDVI